MRTVHYQLGFRPGKLTMRMQRRVGLNKLAYDNMCAVQCGKVCIGKWECRVHRLFAKHIFHCHWRGFMSSLSIGFVVAARQLFIFKLPLCGTSHDACKRNLQNLSKINVSEWNGSR